jgi:hypothetical protein
VTLESQNKALALRLSIRNLDLLGVLKLGVEVDGGLDVGLKVCFNISTHLAQRVEVVGRVIVVVHFSATRKGLVPARGDPASIVVVPYRGL